MQLTRTADYGVRVMTHLAAMPPATRATVAHLADISGATAAFMAKILQRLVAGRLVVSRRGYEGGFELARPAASITLLDIVQALEGPLCLNRCLPDGLGCDRHQWCAAYPIWARAQEALASVLKGETLEQLAAATPRNGSRIAAVSESVA